jgi:SOS-response transcriptional repressor LexA
MTQKQLELLRFIKSFIDANGFAPSFPQMMAGIDVTSKSGVYRLLVGLEEQGRIRRLHNRARAIEIVENPALPVDISGMPVKLLAQIVKQRGMALCHTFRDDYGGKHYVEINP